MTAADLVITTLADENYVLKLRLYEAEADRRVYREIAQQALHKLADLTTRVERQRAILYSRFEVARDEGDDDREAA